VSLKDVWHVLVSVSSKHIE